MFYGLKRVQWLMERSNALDFVTTAAPGLRDLLLIGKIYEIEARRRDDGRRQYDLIVVDAPPTGRIVPFLEAPEGVTEIVRVGPIKRQAGQIREMLQNPAPDARRSSSPCSRRCRSRRPVEAVAALTAAGVAVGPIVANQVVRPRLDDAAAAALDRARRRRAAAACRGGWARRCPGAPPTWRSQLAREHHARRRAADRAARASSRPGPGTAGPGLPLLTGATFDARDLEVLADALALQVGEPGPRAADLLDGIVDLDADRGGHA